MRTDQVGSNFRPGTETWIASDSPSTEFSGAFEDDGQVAYFYAYDRSGSGGEGTILDAVHIYNVADVVDADRDSEAEVAWSTDGLKAGLLINGFLHAVLDFESRRAYCRSNFPPPGGAWEAPEREPWRDDLAKLLK
jgi:hypothetical protein